MDPLTEQPACEGAESDAGADQSAKPGAAASTPANPSVDLPVPTLMRGAITPVGKRDGKGPLTDPKLAIGRPRRASPVPTEVAVCSPSVVAPAPAGPPAAEMAAQPTQDQSPPVPGAVNTPDDTHIYSDSVEISATPPIPGRCALPVAALQPAGGEVQEPQSQSRPPQWLEPAITNHLAGPGRAGKLDTEAAPANQIALHAPLDGPGTSQNPAVNPCQGPGQDLSEQTADRFFDETGRRDVPADSSTRSGFSSSLLPSGDGSVAPGSAPRETVDNPSSRLAFELRLKPSDANAEPAPTPEGAAQESVPARVPAAVSSEAAEPKAQKPRKPEEAPETRSGSSPPPAVKPLTQALAETPSAEESRSVTPRPNSPRPQAPSETAVLEQPVPRKAASPAHDIRLEVAGGDRRVEVRVTERAGELRVAVRTPDQQLAGSLRENLPVLSSKLSDYGFRAEAWHPAAVGSVWRHDGETGCSTTSQNSNSNSHKDGSGQQSGDPNARRRQPPQEHTERKKKGNHFAWLISTLQ